MQHLEAALNYAKQGWPVFPLKPRGKAPLLPGGYHRATTDEAEIRAWWTRWPEANIGIPAGAKTFCVLDVDPKSGGDDTLQALRDEYGDLPPTLMQITGSGGAHYLFQHDERVGNTTSKIGPGIDTRGNDRGYIAVAPSMHELGQRYVWHDDITTTLAKMPDWVIKLLNGRPKKQEAPSSPPPRTAHDRTSVEARAREYLKECEPAVQGQGGHASLLWAATALVHGFQLDDASAFRLLVEDYNPRCSPPWDLSVPAEAKEFRRKLSEGRKNKTLEPGWLMREDPSMDEVLIERAREQAEAMIAAAEPKEEPAKGSALPGYVLHPPGLVGDICSHINSTARQSQPLLALANSLAFCGALFGRKVRDEWNLRTNIYCLGVAESGAGKDHSRQTIKSICAEANIHEDLLGGEEVTSDSAIAARLERNQSVLFLWDEIGHMLASITDRQASQARRTIVPYLMRLTGSAGGLFVGKEYADGQRKDVVQPNVCIYGTTVPSRLYQGLTTSEIRDGLLGRLLVFRAQDDDPDVDDQRGLVAEIPTALISQIQHWVKFVPQAPPGTPDIARSIGVFPVTVPTSKEAQALFHDLRATVKRKRTKGIKEQSPHHPLWARVEEHARRVALILASGDAMTPESAEIAVEHAEAAIALVIHCTEQFIADTDLYIADSEIERWAKRIKQMVVRAGKRGLSQSKITRATQAMSSRQREDVIQTLMQGNEIVRGTIGRAKTYFAPEHYEGGECGQ